MKYDILYHGTSVNNLESILKHGIQPSQNDRRQVWWASSPNLVYAWSAMYCEKYDYCAEAARRYAEESGMAACMSAMSNQIVVFEAKVPLDTFEPDYSGPDTDRSGAIQIECIPVEYLTRYWISEDISLLLPMVSFPRKYMCRPTTALEQWAIEAYSKVNGYWGDAPVYWKEHSLTTKITRRGTTADAL